MKDTTRATIEYLITDEGKRKYRERLAYHRSHESRFEPIWDRFPGYALGDVHVSVGGGHIDQDAVMDAFISEIDAVSPYGDALYKNALPGIVARARRFETLSGHLAGILDQDECSSWGN